MNTYLIPQEMHDENRFLIFSKESLLFVLIGIVIGAVIYFPFFLLSAIAEFIGYIGIAEFIGYIGIGLWIFVAIVAWALGTFKIPESNAFEILKKTGGESVFDIIKRVIKFKKSKKIYY